MNIEIKILYIMILVGVWGFVAFVLYNVYDVWTFYQKIGCDNTKLYTCTCEQLQMLLERDISPSSVAQIMVLKGCKL